MPNHLNITCRDCVSYNPLKDQHGHKLPEGECRIRSPHIQIGMGPPHAITGQPQPIVIKAWPNMQKDEWCGEGKPKTNALGMSNVQSTSKET